MCWGEHRPLPGSLSWLAKKGQPLAVPGCIAGQYASVSSLNALPQVFVMVVHTTMVPCGSTIPGFAATQTNNPWDIQKII